MPLIRLLFIALPIVRRLLRDPAVRRRLGLKPLRNGAGRRGSGRGARRR